MIRKALITLGLVAAVVVLVLLVSGGGGSSDGYQVRAIFDNGGFMVPGEQVRIAGANAGKVESVDVTMPDETVAYRDGKAIKKGGKAVIVMAISDPGFQDFRQDATCQIRPQSLIGEKFVDCRPTMERAPGTPAPPPLKTIPDGQPGEGQHLLPLGQSGTNVDPDLVNDIQSLPYAQRFRLLLNELGGGLAGRGEDIEVLVKRANPVLRDADRLFQILSNQRNELAQLASDSETILGPLSRERAHVAGFFSNAGAAAEASSERGPELEEALQKFPTFLRQFRQTMVSLQGFSESGTPVFEELGRAAPSLTDATRTLTPFSEALTVSLKSLGKNGEASGPVFREAVPVVRKAAKLSKAGVKPTRELAATFGHIDENGGWDGLVELIYNGALTLNGFDQYGHFGRALAQLTNCVDYVGETSGSSSCSSRFTGENASEAANTNARALFRLLMEEEAEKSGGTAAEAPTPGNLSQHEAAGGEAGIGGNSSAETAEGTEPLLDYLLGP
jgi:phospholipid/cholesterol/gamma-HCH transport system substrate-binding protein